MGTDFAYQHSRDQMENGSPGKQSEGMNPLISDVRSTEPGAPSRKHHSSRRGSDGRSPVEYVSKTKKLLQVAILVFCMSFDAVSAQDLVINEVMSKNVSTLADEDGDYRGWVEIYNKGTTSVDMDGFGLTDDLDHPFKWVFPSVDLPSENFLLVFTSGKDRREKLPRFDAQPNENITQPNDIPGLRLWLDATDSSSIETENNAVVRWSDKSGHINSVFKPLAIQPGALPGLKLWLDAAASDSIVMSADGRVEQWLDQSSTDNHASQFLPSLQPILIDETGSDHPVFRFDGIDDYFTFPRVSDIRTVFWVLKENTEVVANWRPLLGDTKHLDFTRGGTGTIYSEAYAEDNVKNGTTWVNGTLVNAMTASVPTDLGLVTTITADDARASTISSDRLANGRVWFGDIAEIVIFNRVLSEGERQGIEEYLRDKWRLPEVSIPATNDATQDNPKLRPQVARHVLSQRPVLRFDGIDDYLSFPRISSIRSVFWVVEEDPSASSAFRPLLGDEIFGDFTRGYDGIIYNKSATIVNEGITRIHGQSVNPLIARIPKGLTAASTITASKARANTLSSDRMAPDRVWHGEIGEVIIYDRALSEDERLQIESYLAQKWHLKNRTLHSNFALKSAGEPIRLVNKTGRILDELSPTPLPAGVSIGRRTDGDGVFSYFTSPTPAGINSERGFAGFNDTPKFSPEGGLYEGNLTVNLEAETDKEIIRYTLDGSEPTESSPVYSTPLQIGSTTPVRARTYRDGYIPSQIITHTFFVNEPSTLPVVSLVTAPANFFDERTGIYEMGPGADQFPPFHGANFWRDWERPVHMEFFNPDSSPGFRLDAGMRIHGGWTRSYPQKSLRIYARREYGSSTIEYPIFPDKPLREFKRILIRNSGNDWTHTLFRDALMHRLVEGWGIDQQAYQPSVLFLNGQYWGIHNLRERIDKFFLASNWDVDPDNIDLLEGAGTIKKGDSRHYDAMFAFIRSQDLREPASYKYLSTQMDLDNFIDYQIAQIYFDNADWPGNNVTYWRPRTIKGKWRWILTDLDGGFDSQGTGAGRNSLVSAAVAYSNPLSVPWATFLLSNLLKNGEFRNRFINRFADRLNSSFHADRVLERIDSIQQEIAPEIERHTSIWGQTKIAGESIVSSPAEWNVNVDRLRAFARERPEFVRQHITDFFRLGGKANVQLSNQNPEGGKLLINEMDLPQNDVPWTGVYFEGVPITVTAVPKEGFLFSGWSELNGSASSVTLNLTGNVSLSAAFAPDKNDPAHFVPAPFDLISRDYILSGFDRSNLAGSFPRNMVFRQTFAINPGLEVTMDSNWILPYDLDDGPGIKGLDDLGFSFINSLPLRDDGPAGHMGAAVLALNTIGTSHIRVSWTGGTVVPNSRVYAIRLQYRIGTEEPFRDVLDSAGNPVEYVRNPIAGHSEAVGPVELPKAADNRPEIQLRWRYYYVGTGVTGSGSELRIDEILVQATRESASPTGDVVISEIMYHPASENVLEEYIELYNKGTTAVNLLDWKISAGVQYSFPEVILPADSYIVVAADVTTFANRYPSVSSLLGNWVGTLSDSGEKIELTDSLTKPVDSVRYADDGDWGERTVGPLDNGYRGWMWQAEHDGGGRSLELINPVLSNNPGQNWNASLDSNGTPGLPNSKARSNIPPMILGVGHVPIVPSSSDPVTVTARIEDEDSGAPEVTLYFRQDGQPQFFSIAMSDTGSNGDRIAGDRIYGATLPPQPNDTIIEFYLRAKDPQGNARFWPAPTQPNGLQNANLLYQVDDSVYTGSQPLYRLIMTEAEHRDLETIGGLLWYLTSDARMNGTFISSEAGRTQLRYNVDIRMRGSTSRAHKPGNRRIHFQDDDLWRGRRMINLNTKNPYAQDLGSALFRKAGVPAANVRGVQVRENNIQKAGPNAPQFGSYAEVEVLNSQFAENHFPLDPKGNLYRADGELNYLGEDQNLYRGQGFYHKMSNISEADWSDVVELTQVLTTTPDESFTQEVNRVVNVREWMRYLAVDTLISDQETNIATGGKGDYALHRGIEDPRFLMVPYDLDSVMGSFGGITTSILRATNNAAINRLLKWPEFASIYYEELRRLSDTVFAPEQINPLIAQVLESYVTPASIRDIQNFAAARRAFVLSQIPSEFTVSPQLPSASGYQVEIEPQTSLTGTADAARTRKVLVNGLEASWNVLEGQWSIQSVPLLPGINSVLIQAIAADGREIQQKRIDIWRDTGSVNRQGGMLARDTEWKAEDGPYQVNETIVVPANVTLTIKPGTSVYFEPGTGILVHGRLLAEGTEEHRIRFTRPPGGNSTWTGIEFNGASTESRLTFFDMGYPGVRSLALINSTVLIDNAAWHGTTVNLMWIEQSSLTMRNSVIPDTQWDEPIRGFGMPEDGHLIFENNVFGTTLGYTDVIDFSGGKRPGPIIEIRNNVFLGGSDDALDFDGTDAHIEGNLFTHFHKNNTSTSLATVIATGAAEGRTSDITAVRNVFYDNDYDVNLKDSAFLIAQNNTFVGSTHASISFDEPDRLVGIPRGTLLEGNIFWDNPEAFGNLDLQRVLNNWVWIAVNESLFEETGPWRSMNNVQGDPQFVDSTEDFRLRLNSPAKGTGPNGLDMGAFVPAGASLSGEPRTPTYLTGASLTVGGPGITHYKFRVNDGAFSAEFPVNKSIQLGGLTDGLYRVSAIGKDSAGRWQEESKAVVSRDWTVDTSHAQLYINEILADNRSAISNNGVFLDAVELFNDSPQPRDLSGLSLSNDPSDPKKFIFPTGTILDAGAYLVVYAGNNDIEPENHLGFALNKEGDALYLFNKSDTGGEVIDSVVFGLQAADLSIGRLRDRQWALTKPTFGSSNKPQPVGQPDRVRINEWLANSGSLERDDFVELYNPDSFPVQLGGAFLSNHPVTAPKLHAVAPLSFMSANGFAVFIADGTPDKGSDHLNFKLPAEQGMIGLYAPTGEEIDLVLYGSQQPDISQGRSPAGGTAITVFPVATPGTSIATGSHPAPVINEVAANNTDDPGPNGTFPDWIELYNPTDENLPLTEMSLTDRLDQPREWIFPPSSVIPPKDYTIIYFDNASLPDSTNTGIGLNSAGDSVYLFDAPSRGGGLLTSVTFGFQSANLSLSKIPNATGEWHLGTLTPNAPNSPMELANPAGLKVNEWMARPLSGDDWFEIYNPDPHPVELSGLFLSDDLNDSFKHLIPQRSFIGVGKNGFLKLIADGRPGVRSNHVDFRLGGNGESIGLFTAKGVLIDSVTFGLQALDVSEGRWPDGDRTIANFVGTPTPGASNVLRTSSGQRPRFRDVTLSNQETVILTWDAVDGSDYWIEYKDDLNDLTWTVLGQVTAIGNAVSIEEPLGDALKRFYRLQQVP